MNVVIGSGIFGLCIAIRLKKEGHNVLVIEKNSDIMLGASKCNHNRIHYGFHYPRSFETAKQSLEGYKLFYSMFKEAIIEHFDNYYMIDNNSKVNSVKYKDFCDTLNLKYETKIPNIDMNQSSIESYFLTNEPIFDYNKIRNILIKHIQELGINIVYNTSITTLKQLSEYKNIFNCSYANINKINNIFNIPLIKLKIQDVIVPIFEFNNDKIGLTIMDGDFCSIMPKGSEKNRFLLYNVKYSVIKSIEGYYIPENWKNDTDNVNEKINEIYKDSLRYYTFLNKCKRISYWRTYRAIPINSNDERLSSIYINKYNEKTIYSVLSGKITTSCLVAEKIIKEVNKN